MLNISAIYTNLFNINQLLNYSMIDVNIDVDSEKAH